MPIFYELISGIPWTPINLIWLGFSLFQTFGFIIIYHTKEDQFLKLKSFLQSLAAVGKSRTIAQRFDVPKQWFKHFYIVATLWNGFVLAKLFLRHRDSDIINFFQLPPASGRSEHVDFFTLVIAVAMLLLHVVRRLYECYCVSVFSPGGGMSPIIYAWGCFYYFILTVTLIAESLPVGGLPADFAHVLTKQHVFGTFVYTWGVFIQHDSLDHLAEMRKENKDNMSRHMLPFGKLFDYVSNPHYLGELLIYGGIWIIIGRQSKSFALVMFYLVITHMHLAKSSHLWYQKNFSNMPANRKALIPFVW